MNQFDQNINKDMFDCDLIDVESMDFSDSQTWLEQITNDSGKAVDILDWNLSCDWPLNEDREYVKQEAALYTILDSILKEAVLAMPDKHKFDSRTYVKPKKRVQRPSIQNIVESPHPSLPQSASKYLTYNKYNAPSGVNPILRLKTFNVDVNTDNSAVIKEFAMKRRSLVQDYDMVQVEDMDATAVEDSSIDRLTAPSSAKPINIDLSQPAHNIHNTFNKGLTNLLNDRGSLNMYQSGESLMRMSPPSLVSSLMMDSSGNFNDDRKSISSLRDSGIPSSGRESRDPMLTSMTTSILDEKDMSTSFLSQTTCQDYDSIPPYDIDSLPPSLVNSVNSSLVKSKVDTDSNIFSSATFTNLENSGKLLSARPRYSPFNSPFNTITKRDSAKNSESYTKAKEEACQVSDSPRILNDNIDKKESPKPKSDMTETITLHYANNKFKRNNDAEKENLNATFETDDTFYKEMGIQKAIDVGKNSLNVTLDKQELNEIIQARQKLSLARRALPTEPDKPLPNQVDMSANKVIQLPNATIVVPRQSIENASELLSRRRGLVSNGNGFDKHDEPVAREPPKRNATFKKATPPQKNSMDATVVFGKAEDTHIIDINSATMDLIGDRTLKPEQWGSQERAMIGSNESTDTGTFSSSSPPDSVPDALASHENRTQIASTPLMSMKKSKNDMMNIHHTISPIYDTLDDKYNNSKITASNCSTMTYDVHNSTVINSATMVKKTSAKRDIMSVKPSPDKKVLPPQKTSPTRVVNAGSYGSMAPPAGLLKKTGLPTSKLRQYSSHKDLSRLPGSSQPSSLVPRLGGRGMSRRGVYASNPALSPTTTHPPPSLNTLVQQEEDKPKPTPVLVRQGTETLRRERPLSQLVAPKDLRASGVGVPLRSHPHIPPPTTRPYSIAGSSQLRPTRQSTAPPQRTTPAPSSNVEIPRPQTSHEPRISALPRPSRLPAPRRTLRPPSVYSVAPAGDMDQY